MSEKEKTAKQILDECIDDIEGGRWICGELTGPGRLGANKPMGCAIGLVGINGGAAEITHKDGVCYAEMNYPSDDGDGRWNESAKEALEALADAVPLGKDHPHYFADRECRVYNYNDVGGDLSGNTEKKLTARQARAWFTKARDSLG